MSPLSTSQGRRARLDGASGCRGRVFQKEGGAQNRGLQSDPPLGPAQENPGSQAQKRPRPSAKASILAEVKGSISASDQGPSGPQGSCQHSAPSISLKEAADVVVRCLTPFYKEGKFASKVG